MVTLIDALPQIAIALGIIAAALILTRQITSMAKGLVGTAKNGEKKSRLQIIEDDIADHGKKLVKLEKHNRKNYAALRVLQKGQFEILDFITKKDSDRQGLPDDLDDMDTGQFEVPDELGGVEINAEPAPANSGGDQK